MVFCNQNCSDLLWEINVLVIKKKLLKSRKFAKILRSLERFVQTLKGRRNCWWQNAFLTFSCKFLRYDELEQLEFKFEKLLGFEKHTFLHNLILDGFEYLLFCGQWFTWIPRYFELDLQTNETKQLHITSKVPSGYFNVLFFSSFSNMKIALPALICPAWEAKSKVIHSKYYKHLAYHLAY